MRYLLEVPGASDFSVFVFPAALGFLEVLFLRNLHLAVV